jgi:muramoyltetrapeptide carboxypeptidase
MHKIFPPKLRPGDEVRIIAPSRSIGVVSENLRQLANARFTNLVLKLSFGDHIEEVDEFNSSSIESRVQDFHAAFSDSNVKAVIAVIGVLTAIKFCATLTGNLSKIIRKYFAVFLILRP